MCKLVEIYLNVKYVVWILVLQKACVFISLIQNTVFERLVLLWRIFVSVFYTEYGCN